VIRKFPEIFVIILLLLVLNLIYNIFGTEK